MFEAHEVCVPCACEDIERCRMERYVSDVRIAYAEIERLLGQISESHDETL